MKNIESLKELIAFFHLFTPMEFGEAISNEFGAYVEFDKLNPDDTFTTTCREAERTDHWDVTGITIRASAPWEFGGDRPLHLEFPFPAQEMQIKFNAVKMQHDQLKHAVRNHE